MAGPRPWGGRRAAPRRSISQAFLLDLLVRRMTAWQEARPGGQVECDVLDVGGGTGGVASALAELGHRVQVVDPSPDALASLERRTAEAGLVGRVSGLQGDAADLTTLVGEGSVDLVVCHRVLEVVDSRSAALAAMRSVLRPGGALSLVVAQRHALVLSQALAGHLGQARRTLADPTRLDFDQIMALVSGAGLAVVAADGIGAIADHVPEAVTDADPTAYRDLVALEAAVSADPAFRAMAPAVHVWAEAPRPG